MRARGADGRARGESHRLLVAAQTAVLGALSCSANTTSGSSHPPGVTASSGTSAGVTTSAHAVARPNASSAPTLHEQPLLLVTDPVTLGALERQGLAFADWFVGRGAGAKTNAELAKNAAYRSFSAVLEADVRDVARRDPHAGVSVARFPHRLFDARWLGSEQGRFELVAVVNRFDRAPFVAESCGETRLVYRLAYATLVGGTPVTSRLPMTVGLELDVPRPAQGCGAVARRWLPPHALRGEALAAWLVSPGAPLHPDALGNRDSTQHRVVVNLQQVRWPSAVRPDLGGHAEYLLRSFAKSENGAYAPATLENTPDAALFAQNPKLKRALVNWLSEGENLKAVDGGTPFLPAPFLAKRAESVTPRGLSRRQNRPFRRVFAASDFAGLDFSRLTRVRSAEGLIRRLDELSCPGCHESRSIAGFHLLGDDPASTPAGNALAGGVSPHLLGELPRRAAALEAALAGAVPDFAQPFAERSDYAGYGAHCALGEADATFAGWQCAPGLTCLAYDAPSGDGVGQCLPAPSGAAGDPCEYGSVGPDENAHRDRVATRTKLACAGTAVCNVNAVGFPGGMCTEGCGGLSKTSACGSIAVLEPFNACVARGEPFQKCLAEHVIPAGLRACSAEAPCRDDYVCARSATGGTCIPPYFLFQLRVDGHP